MATTDLKLEKSGSLAKPGPIGRAVRLLFGLACLSYVTGLIQVADNLIDASVHIRPLVWNGIFAGLFLVSYVINIGFSRPWKKWPAMVSAGIFLALAGAGFLSEGSVETAFLARTIWAWELYIFSHLGAAFVISGIIGHARVRDARISRSLFAGKWNTCQRTLLSGWAFASHRSLGCGSKSLNCVNCACMYAPNLCLH